MMYSYSLDKKTPVNPATKNPKNTCGYVDYDQPGFRTSFWFLCLLNLLQTATCKQFCISAEC